MLWHPQARTTRSGTVFGAFFSEICTLGTRGFHFAPHLSLAVAAEGDDQEDHEPEDTDLDETNEVWPANLLDEVDEEWPPTNPLDDVDDLRTPQAPTSRLQSPSMRPHWIQGPFRRLMVHTVARSKRRLKNMAAKKRRSLAELLGLGLELVTWDGISPIPLVDKAGCIFAVLAGQPTAHGYAHSVREAFKFIQAEGNKAHFPTSMLRHRRGLFAVINVGLIFGKGQMEPTWLDTKGYAPLGQKLLANEHIRRMAVFASSTFQLWAPRLWGYYHEYNKKLSAAFPHLRRPFANSVFSCAAFNFGPRLMKCGVGYGHGGAIPALVSGAHSQPAAFVSAASDGDTFRAAVDGNSGDIASLQEHGAYRPDDAEQDGQSDETLDQDRATERRATAPDANSDKLSSCFVLRIYSLRGLSALEFSLTLLYFSLGSNLRRTATSAAVDGQLTKTSDISARPPALSAQPSLSPCSVPPPPHTTPDALVKHAAPVLACPRAPATPGAPPHHPASCLEPPDTGQLTRPAHDGALTPHMAQRPARCTRASRVLAQPHAPRARAPRPAPRRRGRTHLRQRRPRHARLAARPLVSKPFALSLHTRHIPDSSLRALPQPVLTPGQRARRDRAEAYATAPTSAAFDRDAHPHLPCTRRVASTAALAAIAPVNPGSLRSTLPSHRHTSVNAYLVDT
ncbi:hypothetical protein MSAN_00244100 [Mycena sanguinolenta]|uniref:Uncharacterized protein n=1 Tax=Mycena sanguinolenta TaxID=230812 RepID=A0A8H6ZFT2_9AGAR|nr:hypothetical protein MSAN_00244100 [Mycena sanguinolenta]